MIFHLANRVDPDESAARSESALFAKAATCVSMG